MNNAKRAKNARRAVETDTDNNPLETKISDLLCNLHHLCDREGYDFYELLSKGDAHYVEEVAEELG